MKQKKKNTCWVHCIKCDNIALPIEKMSHLICSKCRTILYTWNYLLNRWDKEGK